jgi:orotidine-5'-phosphate decarboxylase
MATIKVVCTRPMMMHGARVEAGAVLALAPPEAADAIGSGRAVLQNPTDRAAVDAAIRTERDRTLAKCGRVPGELLRFGRVA